jgi:alpha-L-rhamnosidase
MTSARAEYDSVYGKIISDWHGTASGPLSLRLTVPANTSAKVYLPAIPGAHVTESGNPVPAESQAGTFVIQIGSGTYSFEVK